MGENQWFRTTVLNCLHISLFSYVQCPATDKGCGADELSPRKFRIGTCCEAASRWKTDFYYSTTDVEDQMVKVLRKYYLETKKTFQETERENQTCSKEIASMSENY